MTTLEVKHLQGEVERLRSLLKDAYEEGFAEGFYCEDNPGVALGFDAWVRAALDDKV